MQKMMVHTTFIARRSDEVSVNAGEVVLRIAEVRDQSHIRRSNRLRDYRIQRNGYVPSNILSPFIARPPPLQPDKCESPDLACLQDERLLNDDVITRYLEFLCKGTNVHCMSTYFYTKLKNEGYLSVERWTRKVSLFSKSHVLFPIHQGQHWMLVVADILNRRIILYDSLKNNDTTIMYMILDYLNKESLQRLEKPLDEWRWSLITATNFLKQLNSYDCGVYVCKFAKQLFSSDWDAMSMPLIRKQIAACIRSK